MSERKSSTDLSPSVETLLNSFPFPERDWEQDARAVEARLKTTRAGSADTAWLAAPLPHESGEPSGPRSATSTPSASSGIGSQSLADLARRSVQNKQAGEREMARASLALAARQQPIAEEVRALREGVASTAPAALVAPANAPARVSVSAPPNARRRRWLAAMPIAAAGLLAGGVLLWWQHSVPLPLVSTVIATPTKTMAYPSGAATAAAPALQGVPSGIDPSTLPESAAPAQLTPEKVASKAHPSALTPPNVQHSKEKIALADEPMASPASRAPSREEKTSSTLPGEQALPPDTTLRPADSTGGAIPAKPSTGAVQAALGSVMSGARHCVAGEEGPSSALVIFGSDGRVRGVTVSGPASGKSSGSCVEAQLSRARVQPFAAPNFSVTATVRPD